MRDAKKRRLMAALWATCALVLAPRVAVYAQDAPPTPADQATEPAQDALTAMPELIEGAEASYPERAERDGVEAVVVMELDIDASGRVEAARIARGAEAQGYGFDAAALDAARRFVFRPARVGDRPVPVRVTFSYRFALPEVTETPSSDPEPSDALPQVVNLKGQLLERGTRDPMSGATVVVYREDVDPPVGYEADCDAEGRFAFYDLPPGPWSVAVEPAGYVPFRTQETIASGEATDVVYYIERGDYNPFDVVIDEAPARKEVTRRALRAEEIKKVPGSLGGILEAVVNLPGVARSGFGSTDLVTRGGAPEDSAGMIEGVPGLSLMHFGGLRSAIPTDMIEGVAFYPGNFGVRYGQFTGGVLDVQLKRLSPERVRGYADLNLLDAGAYVEAPVGERGAVAIGGRRSYVDAILTSVLPDDSGTTFVTAPRYYDGQILASWRPAPAHLVRAFALITDDAMSYTLDSPQDLDPRLTSSSLDIHQTYALAALYHTYTPNEAFSNSFQVGVSAFNGENTFFGLKSDAALTEGFAREVASVTLSSVLTVNLGGDLRVGVGTADLRLGDIPKEGELSGDGPPLDNVQELNAREWTASGGIFAEFELRPWERLLIIPGLRGDIQPWSNAATLDPRISARLTLSDAWALKGGAGVYHQGPVADEAIVPLGNPDIGAERAVHYAAGVIWQPLEQLSLDVTGFYKGLDDLIVRSDAVVERDGEQVPVRFDNSGEGRAYGLEVMLRHAPAHGFMGWVAYTLSRSERIDPATGAYRLFDQDQTHILTAVASYRLPYGFEVGARWRLVSGNPTTPVEGAAYDATLDQYRPLYGAVNSARNATFHQLDLRVDKQWVMDTWMLTTYLDVQNVTNHTNVEGVSYNYDYSETAVAQGLPFFPAFGVRGDF